MGNDDKTPGTVIEHENPGKDVVEMWRIGDGKVIRDRKPWEKEWGGGPTRGWKPGLKGQPVSRIERS